MEKEYKMSAARAKELQEELNYLKTTRSDEVAEQIKVARGFGDLSENAEYDEAKNEQAEVESKINQLVNMMKFTRVVEDDEIEENTVCLGNTIEIQEVGEDEIETYAIVNPDEIEIYALLNSEMDDILLSVSSPVGKALLGHKTGETVSVETPACTIDFVIKDIYKYEK